MFDLSGLAPYTQQNTDLLSAAILSTKELQNVSIRTNVSVGTTTINVFSGLLPEQPRDCEMTDNGSLIFSQVPITVSDLAIAQNFCVTDLRQYWMAERMKPGAIGGEEMPFPETVVAYVQESIQSNISSFIGTQLASQIAAGGAIQAGAAVLTTANALDQLNDLYDTLSETVKMMDNIVIMLSPAEYRTAVRALVAQNGGGFIHYDFADGRGDIYLPGTTAKLVASQGLIGTAGTRFAYPAAYAIFATGLFSDEETIKLGYDDINDKVILRAYYRRGLSVYSVDECASTGL